MRIAFATRDGTAVDAHFGWCPRLDVWEVTATGARLAATHAFPPGAEDGDEDKLEPRIAALAGCTIVYAAAIGGSASGRVRDARVHPARAAEGEPVAALVERLRALLAGTPPPWLAKLAAEAEGRRPAEEGTP
jgi:nitrogen fixation protein NifX